MESTDRISFYSSLETKMWDGLERLRLEEPNVTIRCNKSLVLITSLLEELRAFVGARPFDDQNEEIHFFKKIKPMFLSQYFYYQQVLKMTLNEPVAATGERMRYYLSALEQTQDFVKRNLAFVAYCMSDSVHFDDKYFVRGFIPPTDFLKDRSFSTGYDEKLSRLKANRRIQEHAASCIDALNSGSDTTKSGLTWTGSKADLIELIYGLETAAVINKGGADIKEIATHFEKLFNITLGNLYRQFLDIRLRKKDRTVFLNQMKELLETKMNDFG